MDIQESVGRILQRGEAVADRFYSTFLGRHPEARAYFADVNLKRQAVLLTMALKLIEQHHVHGYPAMESYLKVLGHRHRVRLIVPAEMYAPFGHCLLEAIREFHGGEWDEGLEDQCERRSRRRSRSCSKITGYHIPPDPRRETSMSSPNPASTLATDVLRTGAAPLDAIFAPRSVALIGATEKAGSVGRTILQNLVGNPFGGTVYPVNPKRASVLGIKAYPSIAAVPDRVDLAVMVTPAPGVPDLMAECVEAGVRGAIIISAGFKETGEAGIELERRVLEQARRGRMRVVGPNCLGVMNPTSGLNATFAGAMARPGNIGFLSQSGALCTAVLDWSFKANVGFSAFVSVGSMLEVGWGDLIDHLGDDPRTTSIIIYMESIGDASTLR